MPSEDRMSVEERRKYLKLVAPRYAKAGHVAISVLTGDQWERLLRVMGREDLVGVEDYATIEGRVNRRAEVDAIVAAWTHTLERDALVARARRQVRDVKRTGGQSATAPYHWTRLANPEDDNDTVPALAKPDLLHILVTGGWANVTSQCIILGSIHGELVTRKIDWSWE